MKRIVILIFSTVSVVVVGIIIYRFVALCPPADDCFACKNIIRKSSGDSLVYSEDVAVIESYKGSVAEPFSETYYRITVANEVVYAGYGGIQLSSYQHLPDPEMETRVYKPEEGKSFATPEEHDYVCSIFGKVTCSAHEFEATERNAINNITEMGENLTCSGNNPDCNMSMLYTCLNLICKKCGVESSQVYYLKIVHTNHKWEEGELPMT